MSTEHLRELLERVQLEAALARLESKVSQQERK